jgi:hypothetical protein
VCRPEDGTASCPECGLRTPRARHARFRGRGRRRLSPASRNSGNSGNRPSRSHQPQSRVVGARKSISRVMARKPSPRGRQVGRRSTRGHRRHRSKRGRE